MQKEQLLKQRLSAFSRNEWNLPEGTDCFQLALELMEHIGTTDPVLRDDLILTLLWKLITEKLLSKEQLRQLMDIALSDGHLFCGLGKAGDDSVFNRSFTVLIVRWIIYYHNSYGGNLFTKEDADRVFTAVIQYVRTEVDVRGYTGQKGWGHAIGHSGDALRALAKCNLLGKEQLLEILQVVQEKTAISYYAYINDEPERLVSAVVNVIERDILEEKEIINWIKGFEDMKRPDQFPQEHYFQSNVKGLLRGLYFRLKYRKASIALLDALENAQNSINYFFNHVNLS